MTNEELVKHVIELAYSFAREGHDPFAALLARDGEIVASSTDSSVRDSDPTAHAELNLIRNFCRENKLFSLEDYTIVSSTEPCVMCSGAIHWAGIREVVFSVSQEKLQSVSGGNTKPKCGDLVNTGKRKVNVIGPVLEDEGMKVFVDFPLVPKTERHAAGKNKKL